MLYPFLGAYVGRIVRGVKILSGAFFGLIKVKLVFLFLMMNECLLFNFIQYFCSLGFL